MKLFGNFCFNYLKISKFLGKVEVYLNNYYTAVLLISGNS